MSTSCPFDLNQLSPADPPRIPCSDKKIKQNETSNVHVFAERPSRRASQQPFSQRISSHKLYSKSMAGGRAAKGENASRKHCGRTLTVRDRLYQAYAHSSNSWSGMHSLILGIVLIYSCRYTLSSERSARQVLFVLLTKSSPLPEMSSSVFSPTCLAV